MLINKQPWEVCVGFLKFRIFYVNIKLFFLQVFNLYDNSHLMILLFALAKWQEKHYDFHVHDFITGKYLSSCIDFS